MSARVLKLQCDSGFYSNVHQDSQETLQPCTPSYLYLWLGNVLLAAFASAFFISNQLHLRWLVVIVPAATLLVAVAVAGAEDSQQHEDVTYLSNLLPHPSPAIIKPDLVLRFNPSQTEMKHR